MRKKFICILGCIVLLLCIVLFFVQTSNRISLFVKAETSTKIDGKDYVKYDKVEPDGRLKAYNKLYLPNVMMKFEVNGWNYLSCFDYFEIVRTDGRVIYDNDGVINTSIVDNDIVLDKSEVVNYPSDLYVDTSICEYNFDGAFASIINAKWQEDAEFTTVICKDNVEKQTYFVEDDDANVMATGNYLNSGVNTGDSNYKIATIQKNNEDISAYKDDNNYFHVAFDGTAYWENGWWGGCGNYATFKILMTNAVYMQSRSWTNELLSNNTIQYNNCFYSSQPFTVVATNLNNYIKIDDKIITPIEDANVLPYSDGFHISITDNGLTKVSIENGRENEFVDYYCIVDNTIPNVEFEYINTNAMDKVEYGKIIKNEDGSQTQMMFAGMFREKVSVVFDYDKDESPESATYTFNGQTREYISGQILNEDGEYILEVSDLVGNKKIISFVIDGTSTKYNLQRLRNDTTFKVSEWFLVNLPSNMNDYGTYSFKTEIEALYFAKKKEQETYAVENNLTDEITFKDLHLLASSEDDKVNVVQVGEYWYYKSKSNENLYVYYFNYELFDEVLEYYAKKYITNKQYYELNKNNQYGCNVENIKSNILCVNGIDAFLIKDFSFLYLDEIETYKIFYDYAEDEEEQYIEFSYNKTFESQILENGLFIIKELDYVGNEIFYYVYIDKVSPQVTFNASVYGSDNNFSNTIQNITNINPVFYYETFEFDNVIDEDNWWCAKIEHNKDTTYYTKEDVLPKLNDIGTGQFTITVYDRSDNIFKFIVYIIGAPPNVEFANEIDNFSFNIRIDKVEVYNLILEIMIYKDEVLLNNSSGYDEYINNDLNELIYINIDTFNYNFSKSGRYVVELKDNFGRCVSYDYCFEKALPTGVLSIENNTATRDNVTFQYNNNKFYVETLRDGNVFYNYDIEKNNIDDTIITCYYEQNEILTYNIKLINLKDEDNIMLYSFTIDRTIPTLNLFNVENTKTTSNDVYLNWEDKNAYALYSLNEVELGQYNENQMLLNEGHYTVTLISQVGNTNTVTFDIDKTLEYEIFVDDLVIEKDNLSLINKKVVFNNNEPLNIFLTKNDEVIAYSFGQIIDLDGLYVVKISDDYGNKISINFQIDTLPPTIDLVNVEDGGQTKINVNFINPSEEIFEIIATKDGQEIDFVLDEGVASIGKYTVKIFDAAGNFSEYNFEIIASFNAGTIALFGGLLALAVVGFCFIKRSKKDIYFEVQEE